MADVPYLESEEFSTYQHPVIILLQLHSRGLPQGGQNCTVFILRNIIIFVNNYVYLQINYDNYSLSNLEVSAGCTPVFD